MPRATPNTSRHRASASTWSRRGVVCLSVALAFVAATAAAAEQRLLQEFQPGPAAGGGEIVEADRRVVARLEKCRERLDAKDYAAAVPLLQSVLDFGEDAFFSPEGAPNSAFRSVRAEASRLIGSIPAKERKGTYDLEFGPVARTKLDAAIEAADADALADVARRYLHTEAGHEAQYRLGVWHFDQGRLLAAGLCLDRLAAIPEAAERFEPILSLRRHAVLVATGETERALEVAAALVERMQGRPIELAGRAFDVKDADAELFAEMRARFTDPHGDLALADDWSTLRGGPRRTGLVAFDPQPNANVARWRASSVVDPFRDDQTDTAATPLTSQLDATIDKTWQGLVAGSRNPLPSTQPIVVGDRVVARTLADVRILDRATGDVRVVTFPERSLEDLVGFEGTGNANPQGLANYVTQRVWGDGNQGTFSSDGRRLYVVEDAGTAVPSIDPTNGQYRPPSRESRLVAYDLATGKIVWQIGGPKGDFPSPLAGWFFLGAPLPIAGGLFAIVEVENEIRLALLEPTRERGRESAAVAWSQPLVAPHLDVAGDPLRRTTGLVPTYADGVFVCPTGTGIFVAIDGSNRSLLWARKFEVEVGGAPVPIPLPIPPNTIGWKDDVVIAASGRLLLTPRTANSVHCVDLRTGADVWRKPVPRGDGLYVAGVADETVVVVGAKEVRALNLADGKAKWGHPLALGMPAGRGFLVPGRAVLPLASNDVAIVDLSKGEVTQKIAAPEGVELGNLVPAGDRVVSQGIRSVDVFAMELPGVGAPNVNAPE